LEDETGISNVIVNPDLYEKYLVLINREKFLRVEGVLQNQDHTIHQSFPRATHLHHRSGNALA
jgi:error-prone DNA polymerase